tara:strand:+ start:297 stop:782 length:486 start_codon:yes stop_codon:yes gene_type:complete
MPLPILPIFVAGVGVGVYLQGGSLRQSAFWTATTIGVSQMIIHPKLSARAAWGGAKYVWTRPIGGMAADLVGSKAAQVTAGAALGYTGGALAATALTSVAEDKGLVYEGATQDLLGFYGFDAGGMDPHYWDQGDRPTPGYFNIPGNTRYIYRHYRNKWFGA